MVLLSSGMCGGRDHPATALSRRAVFLRGVEMVVGVYGPMAVPSGWGRGAHRIGTGRAGSAWAAVMRAF